MHVIFLDVDGVVDSKRRRNHLCSTKLELLVGAAHRTNSRVVISSHWRLVNPQHRQLKAVLRYLGVEVIGATPVRRPWEPERPLEIAEWLQAYNASARELDRPPVTNFVAIDDRDLLSERGGNLLQGHFVRTNVDAGLTAVEAERVVQLFGDVAPEGAAEVLGLAEAMADTPVGDVPRGSFGEVRFAATGPSRKELEPEELAQFTCTLAFKDSWSGAPIGCGDGSGPRPSPWIVKADREAGGTPAKSRFRNLSAAELTVRVGARFARVSARLGGQSVHGGNVWNTRTPTKTAAPRDETPPSRHPHTVHGGEAFSEGSFSRTPSEDRTPDRARLQVS